MARRICRAKNGRFKRCGGGGRKRSSGSKCKYGKVKSGKRKGLCRKQRPRRRR
jgi:hypothetical protein